jgi:hypothetical protein
MEGYRPALDVLHGRKKGGGQLQFARSILFHYVTQGPDVPPFSVALGFGVRD